MSIPAFIERDGVIFVPCRHCDEYIPISQLGQHSRAHRAAPQQRAPVEPDLLRSRPTHPTDGAEQRREHIKNFCTEREIEQVVHFTRIEALARILREGLLPRKTLERQARKGKPFIAVDAERFDGHERAISVSISFPNYQMFYKVRLQTRDQLWVVLSLDPAILWELDCAFCEDNAASADVRSAPLPALKRVEALQAMFADVVLLKQGRVLRSDLSIPDFFPSNPQAEVLVCEPIKPTYISEVAFFNWTQQRQWMERHGDTWPGKVLKVNHGFFRPRPGGWDSLLRGLQQ